jgi:hypothetical protein
MAHTHTLVIAEGIVINNRYNRIEEVHAIDCMDLIKKRNSKEYKFGEFIDFDSLEAARTWYDDEDELGYTFDDEVKVLPCSKK